MTNIFPSDFLWGAATAAVQIEGAYNADGKGLNIWDVAPAKRIKNGDSCREGCAHYANYKQDVALMKEMGLKSYRFSVSWARVMPEKGKINEKGLQFYIDLVNELKSVGIEPLVTLYHWDLPLWVEEEGGWLSEKIIPLFTEYTKAVIDALSDKVTYWMTLNEPQCFITVGYMFGAHAPFKKRLFSAAKLADICMRAHGEAVKVIRKYAKLSPKIGIAMAASAYIPKEETPQAIEEARRKTFYSMAGSGNNRWWGDPIFMGERASLGGMIHTKKKHLKDICQPLDFIGVNVYQPFMDKKVKVPDDRKTMMGWAIDGKVLYWTIRFFHERYGLPIMVTENGMADKDVVSSDGEVHDGKRISFIREYLQNVKRAVAEGIPVLGYQYWSVMDNFEWTHGYEPRFGLTYIDYKTKQRILKDSAYEYKKIIESNGQTL